MTLVLNEIHVMDGLQHSFIVAGADRRITRDGNYHSTQRKLFDIPYLNGAISFFGLAEVYPGGAKQSLSTWLQNFIRQQTSARDSLTFSRNLWNELNTIVPDSILCQHPSGFHISSFTQDGYPDFWFVSNIGELNGFSYSNLQPKYQFPASHFLDRDAKNDLGWDGKNPLSAKNGCCIYRNGDFRAHALAFEALDEIYLRLSSFPDFPQIQKIQQYQEFTKFKFEVIAYFYKKWAKKAIIGRPIDVLVIEKPAAR